MCGGSGGSKGGGGGSGRDANAEKLASQVSTILKNVESGKINSEQIFSAESAMRSTANTLIGKPKQDALDRADALHVAGEIAQNAQAGRNREKLNKFGYF